MIKRILKITGKIIGSIIGGAIALVLLVLIGLNVAKFVIYSEYYGIKEDVCTNPGLSDGFVCQGICALEREEGDVILVSGYMKDKSASRIYVTTTESESYYVSLCSEGKVFTGHAGGIAVLGENAYLANGKKVYTIPISTILKAAQGDVIDVGKGDRVNSSASFIYSDDEYLYVGEFHDGGAYVVEGHENETAEGTHYAICSVYEAGKFDTPVRVYSIRNKVQGICFTSDGKVVLSTSYGLSDSVYYVYNLDRATDSGKEFDSAPLYYLDKLEYEVKGPAMAEGLDEYKGSVITLSESASDKYIFGKFFFADKIVALDFKK